jgi:hypothetical protein
MIQQGSGLQIDFKSWAQIEAIAAGLGTVEVRSLIGDGLTGGWTLGGRRGLSSSLPPTTKGADQQELPEALFRTRTGDPLLTMELPRQRWQPVATVSGCFPRFRA